MGYRRVCVLFVSKVLHTNDGKKGNHRYSLLTQGFGLHPGGLTAVVSASHTKSVHNLREEVMHLHAIKASAKHVSTKHSIPFSNSSDGESGVEDTGGQARPTSGRGPGNPPDPHKFGCS
eukprot:566779-Pelagomonas_calceolata.AAC.1